VREDVLDDFTSVELAREAYGVVFADEGTLEIDEQATEKLRAELAAKRDTSSLTEWYAGRGLPPAPAPVSAAGNAEFSMS
jgi:N-methylhydantoinase B